MKHNNSLKISCPREQDYYTDATKEALAPLGKEIAAHNKKVDTHEQARARVESDDIEAVSAKDIFEGPASNNYRFDLYGKAIELCDKVEEFNSRHVADHRAHYQDISDQLDSWRVRIREDLTKLGYVEEALHPANVNPVNNFYLKHPEVLKLTHLKNAFSRTDRLTGGDRALLVTGMANLRKRCLAT